jgi:O-antigen/teichoic acid export membrane protein
MAQPRYIQGDPMTARRQLTQQQQGESLDAPANESAVRTASVAELSLRSLVSKSAGWVLAGDGIFQVGATVRYLIFARRLRPFDFGVFAAAWSCGTLLRSMTDPGYDQALVVRDGEPDCYLDTVWTTMLIRAAVIAAIMIAAAKPLAVFFKMPEEYPVFYLAGFVTFLSGLRSPASTALISRKLDFHILLVLNSADIATSTILGVAAIFVWHDWRALVAANYASHLVRSGLSYWFFPYRPRLRLDRERSREMFGYGRWITLRRITEIVSRDLGNLVVGHVLGAQPLGEFQMALRLGELPAVEAGATASVLLFPLAARRRRSARDVRRLVAFGSLAVAAVGIVYAAAIFGIGSTAISFALGSKWLGSLAPMRWLCVYGLVAGLLAVGRSVLDGVNLPHRSLVLSLINLGALGVTIYPLTTAWGTVGAALAFACAAAISLAALCFIYASSHTDLSHRAGEHAHGETI